MKIDANAERGDKNAKLVVKVDLEGSWAAFGKDLRGSGPPSWSQFGRRGLPRTSPKPPQSTLLGTCVQAASQEVPKWLPRGPKESPEADFLRISDRFGNLFSLFLPVKIDSLYRNSKYHVYVLAY